MGSQVIETNGKALVEFFKIQPGNVHVCLEEGTQATWLAEILTPHVSELVVTIPSTSRGQKSDELDAFAQAELLRRGAVDVRVYKEVGSFGMLRQLVKTHVSLVDDTRRVQNRLKALYRSRGVPTPGKTVYNATGREEWLARLPKSSLSSAEILYTQYDAMSALKNEAEKQLVREAHRHPITRKLETCPGMGPIRVARFVSVVVTPHRFRGRRQLWSYCGLAVVMRTSSDWEQQSDRSWAKVKKTSVTNGLKISS